MEPKDTSSRHFFISLIKSSIRIAAGALLIYGSVSLCGMLLIIAEVLGIAEEI